MSANTTIALVYCGVAVVSAFILIFDARTVADTTERYSNERTVSYAFLSAGFAAIFDCAYTLREMEVVAFSEASSYVLTIAYVLCASLIGTFWVCYSEKKQNSWFARTRERFVAFCIPLVALLIFVVTTPLTHWYFYFEDGHYQRGPLFSILSLLLLVYVIQNGFTAFIRSLKKENYVNRKEYRRLYSFAIVYLLIQAIQLSLPAIFPYRSVGTMLMFEVFLTQSLKEKIGKDPLTHISNRFAAERQMGALFNSRDRFEVVALDVDKFKSINDKFGHQEGDKALQILGEALKASVERSCFLARMGGDEFIVINENMDNSIVNVEEKINQNISRILEEQNREYRFTVSVGYALKDESIKSIPDLIKLADNNLYARKSEKNRKAN